MIIDINLNSNLDIYKNNNKETKNIKIVLSRSSYEAEKIKRYFIFKKGSINQEIGFDKLNINYLTDHQAFLDKIAISLINELSITNLKNIEFISIKNDIISFYIYMIEIEDNKIREEKYYMEWEFKN